MQKSIDIVLPCFNPNLNCENQLLNFYFSAKELYNINFIIVNDGSTEKTIFQIVQSLQLKNISLQFITYNKNMGKGFALRKGIAASKNDFVVYTDVDFPFTNISMLSLILTLVNDKCDVVVGYRNNFYYNNNISFFRKLLSKSFRFFSKKILKMKISDTQCGLKGLNKLGKIKFLKTKINRYLFDFEFIYLSSKDKSLLIESIPVSLKENIIFSKMKFKIILQEIFNLFKVLFFN